MKDSNGNSSNIVTNGILPLSLYSGLDKVTILTLLLLLLSVPCFFLSRSKYLLILQVEVDVEVDGQVVLMDEIIGTPEDLTTNCKSLLALYNRAPFK